MAACPFASARADRRWRSPRRAWWPTRCAPRTAGTRTRSRSCRSPRRATGSRTGRSPRSAARRCGPRSSTRCLIDGRTDLSVHSMKDVETIRPAELAIAAMLRARRRARPADRRRQPRGAAARARGSAPPRRGAPRSCSRAGPTSSCVPFRGNVETRLAKVARGRGRRHLARRGRARPARHRRRASPLDLAAGAGAGRDRRRNRWPRARISRLLLAAIDHRADAMTAVRAERAFLAALGGDCHSRGRARCAEGGDGAARRDPQRRRPRGPARREATPRRDARPTRLLRSRPARPCARCSADEDPRPAPAARRRRDRGARPRARPRAGGRAACSRCARSPGRRPTRPASTR